MALVPHRNGARSGFGNQYEEEFSLLLCTEKLL